MTPNHLQTYKEERDSVRFKSAERSCWVLDCLVTAEELGRRGTIIDMFPHQLAMGCSSKRTKTLDPSCRSEANTCQPAVGKRCGWMLRFCTWKACLIILAFNGPSAIPPHLLMSCTIQNKRIHYPNCRSFQCGVEQQYRFMSFTCNVPVYCPTVSPFFTTAWHGWTTCNT